MIKKESVTTGILVVCFVFIFSFTSWALTPRENTILNFIFNKTCPEINYKNANPNKVKEIENSKTVTKSGDYFKIELTDENNEKIKIISDENNTKPVAEVKEDTKIEQPEKIELVNGKPQILIYHTHATESYEPESVGNFHSMNKKYSVIEVGEKLKQHMEEKGYSVIHNTTYHDYPSFNGSYKRSIVTAQSILKKYESIKVIFDIHRDGVDVNNLEWKNRARSESVVTINGEKVARFCIVVGPESPNRKEVEKFAQYVTSISNKKYPGLAKKVIVKPYGKFNQFLSNDYGLFEIGGNVTSIDESVRSTKYIAEILDEALKTLKR